MNYPISKHVLKISPGRTVQVDDDVIAAAITAAITAARAQGQSLEDLTAQVMADDSLLDPDVRRVLNEIVVQAWHRLPATA